MRIKEKVHTRTGMQHGPCPTPRDGRVDLPCVIRLAGRVARVLRQSPSHLIFGTVVWAF